MGSLIKRITDTLGMHSDSSQPNLDQAIEWVLDKSHPKLRQIRGHKRRLRQAVETALNVVTGIIETIPGPLDITSEKSIYEGLIKPFFVNPSTLRRVLVDAPDLNRFVTHHPTDDFFVLLTMKRAVKTIFGSRCQDGILLRDEALKTVSFSDHRFSVPSVVLDELKQTLAKNGLQILAHGSLESVNEEQSREERLSLVRDEVKIKLEIMAARRQSLVLEEESDSATQAYQSARQVLKQIEEELNALKTRSFAPDYYLAELGRLLSEADQFFSSSRAAMHFDHLGILLDGRDDGNNEPIQVLEVKLGDTLRQSCILLKCNPQTLFR